MGTILKNSLLSNSSTYIKYLFLREGVQIFLCKHVILGMFQPYQSVMGYEAFALLICVLFPAVPGVGSLVQDSSSFIWIGSIKNIFSMIQEDLFLACVLPSYNIIQVINCRVDFSSPSFLLWVSALGSNQAPPFVALDKSPSSFQISHVSTFKIAKIILFFILLPPLEIFDSDQIFKEDLIKYHWVITFFKLS